MDLLYSGKRPFKDMVSPHKLALLGMIQQVCVAKNKLRKPACEDEVPWFDSHKQRREFAITTLELIQKPARFLQVFSEDLRAQAMNCISKSSEEAYFRTCELGPDLEILKFTSEAKAVLSDGLYEAFLSSLQDTSTGGISGLMDFIKSLEGLLVEQDNLPPVVHKSSVIGLFVRQMILAFDKLSFGQMTKLYSNFKNYCSSLSSCESTCEFQDSDSIKFEEAIPTSRRQAELFVAQQVSRLQTNEKAALSPLELQKRLRFLLTANPSLAEAHFLSLMNCLRVREYCGAVHSVHRTFDCFTIDDMKSDEPSRNFRFAALNLGALLCRFGFQKEATLAIQEAMTMAREANDNVCLQHALAWLYRLDSERKDVLVERSITKTGELALPYLASIGILTFSQMKAITPANPSQVFEFLRRCDILNYKHSIVELTTQSYAQKLSLWNLYGKKQMVWLTIQLLLYLNTSDPNCKGLYHSGEAMCRAYCQLAILLAKEGKFDHSSEVLSLAKDEFPAHSTHACIWMFAEQLMNYERALWQGKWLDAESALTNLALFDSPESKIRKAEMLVYKGELSVASQILDTIITSSDMKDPEYKVRGYLLLGQCYCHANAPSMAILPLNKALTLAQQYHLRYYQDVVTLYLSNLQYLIGYANKALQLINSIKVNLLAHGSFIDHGKLKLLHAKCTYKKAQSLAERQQQTAMVDAALGLGNAADDFLKAEALFLAKDAFYRQACIFNLLGQYEKRNKAASQFRQLDQLCGSTTLIANEIL